MDNIKSEKMGNLIIVIAAVLSMFGMLYFVWYVPMSERLESLERERAYIDTTYLSKQGSTSTYDAKLHGVKLDGDFLNYYLKSWDAGKTWYAIDGKLWFDKDELKILGLADSVYPKLLEHLQAWDDLTDRVQKKGAINPHDSEGRNILEKAGFTVTEKTN